METNCYIYFIEREINQNFKIIKKINVTEEYSRDFFINYDFFEYYVSSNERYERFQLYLESGNDEYLKDCPNISCYITVSFMSNHKKSYLNGIDLHIAFIEQLQKYYPHVYTKLNEYVLTKNYLQFYGLFYEIPTIFTNHDTYSIFPIRLFMEWDTGNSYVLK